MAGFTTTTHFCEFSHTKDNILKHTDRLSQHTFAIPSRWIRLSIIFDQVMIYNEQEWNKYNF